MITLFEYQEKAVIELTDNIDTEIAIYDTLSKKGKAPQTSTIHFVAPTGSGKTIMAFATMHQLAEIFDNLVFIWIAPNTLHSQTLDKFATYSESVSSRLNPIDSDNIDSDNTLKPNQILCLNWSSVDKASNSLIKENESGKYISNIISKTKEEGSYVVVFIDESHIATSKDTTKANELIKGIAPVLRVEITATPKNIGINDKKVVIAREEVIKAGVIKKEFIFNDIEEGMDTLDKEALTACAYKKLVSIKEAYDSVTGGRINPLMIIQIENDSNDEFRKTQSEIESYLDKLGILQEHRADYLSESKENADNLAKNDNPVQIVFTKTAIATGWDCPRASVLLTFRKSKDDKFKTQVLGRINRMPELKHYDIEILDTAYVYANMSSYIPDDLSDIKPIEKKDKPQTESTTLKDECRDIFSLPLFTKESVVEYFYDSEYDMVKFVVDKCTDFWSKIKDKEPCDITEEIVKNLKVDDIDQEVLANMKAGYKLTNKQIESIFFDRLKKSDFKVLNISNGIIGNLFETGQEITPFETDKLMNILKETSSIEGITFLDIIKIILKDRNNLDLFAETIEAIKYESNETRFATLSTRLLFKKIDSQSYWTPMSSITVIKNGIFPFKKSIYKSQSLDSFNDTELFFVCMLEKDKDVKYWYKNGDKGKDFFRIPYKKEHKIKEFFPDFVVYYIDGSIGIYDTKSEMTASDGEAKDKAEYLYSYRIKHNFKGGLLKMVNKGAGLSIFIINQREYYKNYDANKIEWEEFGKSFDSTKKAKDCLTNDTHF